MKNIKNYIEQSSKLSHLSEYILEAKVPSAKELGHRCKDVAYDMIKQIALGGYENNEGCAGIKQADEKELTHIMEVIIDAVGWKGSLEKTILIPAEELTKSLGEAADNEYKWIEGMLNKKQLEIYKDGRSTGNDKASIVADLYLAVIRFAWKNDKGAVEDLCPEKYKK